MLWEPSRMQTLHHGQILQQAHVKFPIPLDFTSNIYMNVNGLISLQSDGQTPI